MNSECIPSFPCFLPRLFSLSSLSSIIVCWHRFSALCARRVSSESRFFSPFFLAEICRGGVAFAGVVALSQLAVVLAAIAGILAPPPVAVVPIALLSF